VVLSTTTIGARTVLRAAFVNHRSDEGDADAVVPAVLGAGLRRLGAGAVAADQHLAHQINLDRPPLRD